MSTVSEDFELQPDMEANDSTRSSYGREYWLRRCQGFPVETPTKRLGPVTGIRYGETTNEPEVLEVRAGLFGRTHLLISVHSITEIHPEQQRLVLAEPPRRRLHRRVPPPPAQRPPLPNAGRGAQDLGGWSATTENSGLKCRARRGPGHIVLPAHQTRVLPAADDSAERRESERERVPQPPLGSGGHARRGAVARKGESARRRFHSFARVSSMGREGFEPSTLGLRVPCSTS